MENTDKLKSTKDVVAYISGHFPQCFVLDGEVRPLKIGIFQDLVKRLDGDTKVSKTQLRSALRQYTSSWRYLHGVKLGAIRIDLDGKDSGELENEHIEHAKTALAESKARFYANKKSKSNPKKPNESELEKRRENKPSLLNSTKDVKSKRKAESFVPKTIPPLALNKIVVGQQVCVNMGRGNISATIIEISKDGVRVQLNNGLQMVVKNSHLRA